MIKFSEGKEKLTESRSIYDLTKVVEKYGFSDVLKSFRSIVFDEISKYGKDTDFVKANKKQLQALLDLEKSLLNSGIKNYDDIIF